LVQGNYNQPFVSWKEVKNDKTAWEKFWNDFRVRNNLIIIFYYFTLSLIINITNIYIILHYEQVRCTWLKKFDGAMIKIFNKKCSKRLSALLSNVRCTDSKPDWIGDQSWPVLKGKWASEDYKEKCKKAAANRHSDNRGGCNHRGGQTSGATFRAEYFALHGCEPTLCQMHEFFHRRPNGEWDTDEAARVQVYII
jgi:hypothetical protein